MSFDPLTIDVLWRNALLAVPIAVVVALLCRYLHCRPATRHALWVVVLLAFLMPPVRSEVDWTATGAEEVVVNVDQPVEEPESSDEPGDVAPIVKPERTLTAESRPVRTPTRRAEERPARADRPNEMPAALRWFAVDSPAAPAAPIVERSTRRDVQREVARSMNTEAPPSRETERSAPERRTIIFPAPPPSLSTRGQTPPPPQQPFSAAVSSTPLTDESSRPSPATAQVRSIGSNVQLTFTAMRAVALEFWMEAKTWAGDRGSAIAADSGIWAGKLAAVRDAVLALPPVPAAIWLGGMLAILLVLGLRVARSRAVVWRSEPAPSAVQRLVTECAGEVGLRRTPQTFFCSARVSPMIWCGRTPRLVLPSGLWRDLDVIGRRAVILHELAHLKRRDHWICWLQLLVGLLYWWHPLLWWVRRRLEEEADYCCDAWVTSLLPTERHCYAQALLDTKRFLSGMQPIPAVAPAVGLGVHRNHAQRFARRLTMVMTDQKRPNLTMRGVALVGVLALLVWLVTPIIACPPKDKNTDAANVVSASFLTTTTPEECPPDEKADKSDKIKPTIRLAVPAVETEVIDEGADDLSTFEQYMRDRADDDTDDLSADDRIERLEEVLDRIGDELARLLEQRAAGRAPAPLAYATTMTMPTECEDTAASCCCACCQGTCCSQASNSQGSRGVISRVYTMPRGKLRDFSALVTLDDVPLQATIVDDGVCIVAPQSAQDVIGSFVTMIDEGETARDYTLPRRQLEAMNRLMRRSDVPIIVEPRCKKITVHGDGRVQATFRAFRDLLQGANDQLTTGLYDLAVEVPDQVQWLEVQHDAWRSQQEAMIEALEEQMRSLERMAEEFESQMIDLEDQAEEVEAEAEEIADEAEVIAAEAAQIAESACELAGAESAERRAEAHARRAEAQSRRHEANGLRGQLRGLRSHAASLERQVESVQRQRERIERQVEEIVDRVTETEAEREERARN